jgi:K(+)-stimulated pyrophosphate-energized sodium pump
MYLRCVFVQVAEYFTSFAYQPTKGIYQAGVFGPANVIIEGISVGAFSTIGPVIIIASTILAVYQLAGSVYGIALASTGMLSTLSITLATDAYVSFDLMSFDVSWMFLF